MMLNTLELNIGRTELIKILNALVYSSYKKPKMADNKIDYLTKLCKKLNVDESELKSIFTVDTRFGFNYKKFLENEVSNNGSRFFLFLMYITVELFDDSDLSKFIENEILVLLHYDENIQKDIKEISKEYIKSTLKVNSNLFLGQNKNREEYQTLTLSTNDKLHGIKRQEKVSFIKIFIHLMWIDNTIDDLESALIDTYMDLLNVRREEIGSNEKYRDIKVLKNIDIQSKWLRSFLCFKQMLNHTI